MGLPADFQPANQGGGNQIYFRDIDLSIARNGAEFELPGFSFMSIATEAFDSSGNVTYSLSTGLMLLQLDDPGQTKLLAKSGSEFNVEPARKIYVTNAAQPNKMLRVYFATYPFLRQVPQFNATPSSANVINLGSSFANVTANGAVQTLLAPAANLNGIILRSYAWHVAAGYNQAGFYADATAPAAYNDLTKRALFMTVQAATSPQGAISATPNLFLPAGWGLFFASSTVQGTFSATWDAQ